MTYDDRSHPDGELRNRLYLGRLFTHLSGGGRDDNPVESEKAEDNIDLMWLDLLLTARRMRKDAQEPPSDIQDLKQRLEELLVKIRAARSA